MRLKASRARSERRYPARTYTRLVAVFAAAALTLASGCVLLPSGRGSASAAEPLPDLLTEIVLANRLLVTNGDHFVTAVATSPVTGHVYVAEHTNRTSEVNRISEFTAWGSFVRAIGWGVENGASELQTCTANCQPGLEGEEPGEFEGPPRALAVDSAGDLYAADAVDHRVEKFSPAGEFLLMFGHEVDKTTKANVCTKADIGKGDQCGAGTAGTGPGEFGNPPASPASGWMTVGPGDVLYVGDMGRIEEFETDGTYKGDFPDPESLLKGEPVTALASDSSGDVYVVVGTGTYINEAKQHFHLYKLSGAGVRIGTLEVLSPTTIAADPAGDLYVLSNSVSEWQNEVNARPEVREFAPDGEPLIAAGSRFATPLGPPYKGRLTALAANTVGDLFVSTFAEEESTWEYSYLTVYGPSPVVFEPPPAVAPDVLSEYAASADPEDATVRAQVNPHFWSDTRYYVQYGTTDCAMGGCSEQPVAPGSLLTEKSVSRTLTTPDVHLPGLRPDTTYHYRFVVQSGGGGPVYGPDRTFVTFPTPTPPQQDCPNAALRTGASAFLPDCRAFEMVSPVDKNGGDARPLPSGETNNSPAALDESSLDGEQVTYSAYRAFGDAQSAPYSVQYVASRDGGAGWSNHAISPPRELTQLAGGPRTFADTPFRAFTPDLSQAWLIQDTDPLLASGAVPGFVDLYRRDNVAESYEALTTVAPPHAKSQGYVADLQGVSADGHQAVFAAEDNLTPEAPVITGSNPYQVYDMAGGQLRLVSILPNGTASKLGSSAGSGASRRPTGRASDVQHAMSSDGSRVFWTEESLNGAGKVYLREHPDREQSAIEEGECSEPTKACTIPVSQSVSASPARFWMAATDGSRAIFSFAAGPHADDLYEYDVATRQPTLIAHKVEGVAGASEDASYVYFVSTEAIAGTTGAIEGQLNLYLHHGETTTFIATIGIGIHGNASPIAFAPNAHYARATPDGHTLVFLSSASSTGYENVDVNSGAADVEVYRYEADSGRLDCLSCNRTGARPAGREVNNDWVAAMVPHWQDQLYQSRYVSDDGRRVFFDSFDALVPQDTNGKEDVYEWEAPGTGGCSEQSVAYSPPNGGCVGLISTGEAPTDTEFLDASPSGNDVFLLTDSSLVAQDPGLYDVYDARVNGGFPAPVSRAACEGEACQSPVAPPAESTPGSLLFFGAGNLLAPFPPAAKPQPVALTRAQKLARALRACQAKPRKRRAACRAHARKRYGGKARRAAVARSANLPSERTGR